MHASNLVQTSTPMSTTSSTTTTTAITNNIIDPQTGVQSGPYTKAQFLNTMEGSRSVKNAKEVEQLLRDYPAALELYHTGRYKVKIKNEADIERVILVEKRASKMTSTNVLKPHENQVNNPFSLDASNPIERKRDNSKENQPHIRTHSNDRTAPVISIPDKNTVVQTTGSSIRLPSNTQPKVDNHRALSKERDVSITSQSKQQSQESEQQPPPPQQPEVKRRSNSRDSRSKRLHSKSKGKRSHREYQNAVVPYVPNANGWPSARVPQPYYSNPLMSQQPLMPNMYMPSPYGPPQYPGYQQPYYYGPQPFAALTYQKPTTYPASSTIKSTATMTHKTVPGLHNYPSQPQSGYHSGQGAALPPTFHTFHLNQQHYPHNIYHSQLPYQMPAAWQPAPQKRTGLSANHTDDRQSAKHRARSLDTGPRDHPPVRFTNVPPMPSQPQPPIVVTEYRHHHPHPQPPTIQVTNNDRPVEPVKDQNVPARDPQAPVPANKTATAEKLTIRQLNEIFLQTDSSGRLPYNALPNILQRFGIALTENDLTSSAQRLSYNPIEPLSARRLVHVLVDLGKIAKSTQQPQQQQRPAASPVILPEDREVNDIMTQRRAVGTTSTHVHSSLYPNHWY